MNGCLALLTRQPPNPVDDNTEILWRTLASTDGHHLVGIDCEVNGKQGKPLFFLFVFFFTTHRIKYHEIHHSESGCVKPMK